MCGEREKKQRHVPHHTTLNKKDRLYLECCICYLLASTQKCISSPVILTYFEKVLRNPVEHGSVLRHGRATGADADRNSPKTGYPSVIRDVLDRRFRQPGRQSDQFTLANQHILYTQDCALVGFVTTSIPYYL